jgi:hypothetical protein
LVENEPELREFLVEAKQNTYAGNGREKESCRPSSKDLPYQKGKYYYLDSYIGASHFIGEEVVWHDGRILWGMNYYGELLAPQAPAGFAEFLKDALRRCTPEWPFRGPRDYAAGGFEYCCEAAGELGSFMGEERVSHQGAVVYRLRFHGGYLR